MSFPTAVEAESAWRMRCIGHSPLGERGDALQVMVARGHAYVGHFLSAGVTVVDVRDPRRPTPVNFLPVHPRCWSMHLQSHGELLLVIEEFNFKSVISQQEYYAHSIHGLDSSKFGTRGVDYSAGMRVYDLSDPAAPRAIGFLEVQGMGLHRLWWTGGRYVYASAMLDGFTDHILIVIDLADPTRPKEVGRWWLPGMWAAGGERRPEGGGRVALHHAVVSGNTAYGCWRDGGLTLLDVSDPTAPTLIAHRNWSPPFGGGTHSALPLPGRGLLVVADEAVLDVHEEPRKPIWMFDIRCPANPVSIATFPVPAEQDYVAKGGHFGPHNLHENRPGSFVSEDLVFATYQNAGVRAYDLRDPFRPQEAGWWVPPPPTRWMEPRRGRTKVVHTGDLYADADGLLYVSDYDAGLYVVQWEGVA